MVWKYDTGIDDLLVTHAVSLQLVYMICFKGSKQNIDIVSNHGENSAPTSKHKTLDFA